MTQWEYCYAVAQWEWCLAVAQWCYDVEVVDVDGSAKILVIYSIVVAFPTTVKPEPC